MLIVEKRAEEGDDDLVNHASQKNKHGGAQRGPNGRPIELRQDVTEARIEEPRHR
jgi:hypothetical protein